MTESITDYNIMGYTYHSEGDYHWELAAYGDSIEEATDILKELVEENRYGGMYTDFRIERVVTTVVG